MKDEEGYEAHYKTQKKVIFKLQEEQKKWADEKKRLVKDSQQFWCSRYEFELKERKELEKAYGDIQNKMLYWMERCHKNEKKEKDLIKKSAKFKDNSQYSGSEIKGIFKDLIKEDK